MPRCRGAGGVTLLLIASLTLGSCAKKAPRAEVAPPSGESPSYAHHARVEASPARGASRLLVSTASMRVAVASVTEAVQATLGIVGESGGYVQESVTEKDSTARLKLRVPARQLTPVLDRVGALGEEKRRQVSTEDVTDQTVDLEAELANKRALRDRLRSLLARAKDVKDVLAVESELTRVQTEIDSLDGRLKMQENISFSTVDLELQSREAPKKKRILGPLGYLFVGAKWLVTELFVIRPGE